MKENFAELFEESIARLDLRPGTLVKAKIIALTPGQVVVNAGLKSDAIISATEFTDEQLSVGDVIDVVIETVENGFGETRLSREKARRARTWLELEKSYETGEPISGTIIERVKGGFTVEIDSVRAFLPGSLVDVKPVRDPGYLEGKTLEFKIIKMDQKRNNVVLSRRAILERETSAEREARLDRITGRPRSDWYRQKYYRLRRVPGFGRHRWLVARHRYFLEACQTSRRSPQSRGRASR